MSWWAAFGARRMQRQQLLPWLRRVGRISGHSYGSGHLVPGEWRDVDETGEPGGWGERGGRRRADAVPGIALRAATAAATDLYRTSCIVGHLEVDDGVTTWGERLWHCRRPGCGAGRFAPLRHPPLA
jgi:hypothetical protein